MRFIFTLFIISICTIVTAQSAKYSRVKINTDHEGLSLLTQLGVTVDHGQHKEGVFYISDFSLEEIKIMKDNNFNIEILIDDVQAFYVAQNKNDNQGIEKNVLCENAVNPELAPKIPSNFNLGSMGGFLTYAEYLQEIDQMAAQYPNLITVKVPIDTFQTFENRPIYWMRLSDNANTNENEPEVLYTSIHHAREPLSLSSTIFYMWYLLENYATNPEVQYLVNNTEMYFVPVLNPDGYIWNEITNPQGGGMWRKNRFDNNDGYFGVDLNRNYSYEWNTVGVSSSTFSDIYPGTSAFSEPETQAMRWLCNNNDFQFAFNAHTYSDLLLFPFGTSPTLLTADHSYFSLFTDHMVQFNEYTNQKASFLYLTSGNSDDYMYTEDLVAKPKIFAMTPEISNETGGFWPAATKITSLAQEMVFTNKVLAHLTHKYLEVKEIDPITIVATSGNFNHTATRLGLENGAITVSIQPLLNIQSVGAPIVYNLALEQSVNSSISYVLNPNVTIGSVIKYILLTDNGLWIRRDTVVKSYGLATLQVFNNFEGSSNWNGWSPTNEAFFLQIVLFPIILMELQT
jgi:carboxypeptidase T